MVCIMNVYDMVNFNHWHNPKDDIPNNLFYSSSIGKKNRAYT